MEPNAYFDAADDNMTRNLQNSIFYEPNVDRLQVTIGKEYH